MAPPTPSDSSDREKLGLRYSRPSPEPFEHEGSRTLSDNVDDCFRELEAQFVHVVPTSCERADAQEKAVELRLRQRVGAFVLNWVLGRDGVALVLVALLGRWDDGLAAGPGLFVLAYAVSLTNGTQPLDWGAPLVAVGLVAVVELGAWSLELRDGSERWLVRRLPQLGLVFVGALAASALVLTVGSIRSGAGIALFVLGAAAAAGLLALIMPPARATFRRSGD